jgi:hypothetical protein
VIQPGTDLPSDPSYLGDLLSFLASSGHPDAYRALAKDLGAQPIERRFWVVSAFLGRDGTTSILSVGPSALAGAHAERPDSLAPEAARVLEDLLGERLGDQSEAEDVWMDVGGSEVDARLGHVAARALAAWFPERYRYEPRASAREREEQRLQAQNLWRAARGLTRLAPAPPRPRPTPLPEAEVLPLLERFLAAEDDASRAAAAAEVERRGLGALPALVARVRALPDDAPRRRDLEALGGRMASTVAEVLVTKDSVAPGEALATALAEVKDRPFSGAAFVRLLVTALRTPPEGAVGIRIRVARPEDLSGAVLSVTLLREPLRGWGRHEPGWFQLSTSGPDLRVGDVRRGGSSGGMSPDYALKPETWKDAAAEIDEAFRAAPGLPVTLRFTAVREE